MKEDGGGGRGRQPESITILRDLVSILPHLLAGKVWNQRALFTAHATLRLTSPEPIIVCGRPLLLV
jgi:hypothetical protein